MSVAVLLLAGCRGHDQGMGAREEGAVLKREIAGLRDLVDAAERGTLNAPDRIVVGIEEGITQGLLNVSLPQERVLGERLRVRLERAEVRFGGAQSEVVLHGRVSPPTAPETYADLVLAGGLDELAIDPTSSELTARVALDHFEVERAATGGAPSLAAQSLLESVAGQGLDALKKMIPPLQIPVRLEQFVTIKGFGDGTVSVEPGRLPLHVSVDRVIPLNGRLWILLDVSTGPWQKLAADPQESTGAP